MHKKSNNTIAALIAIIALGSIFLVAEPAHANVISYFQTGALNLAMTWITYLIGFIASVVFSFGGFLIDLALELNSRVAQTLIVQNGWTIVLNMTNLAFVLGIIWIAIATILRMQGYAMKQILWKLIVAAVMVNFSLVISGFFLDFAGLMTEFFVEKSSPSLSGSISFSRQLAASLRPQGNLSTTDDPNTSKFLDKVAGVVNIATLGTSGAVVDAYNAAENLVSEGSLTSAADIASAKTAQLNMLVNLLFGTMFTVIGAIVFLGIAVMLLVRYLTITILLILAPIVWLGWVFPAMGKYWSEWWSTFIKWTFFAPISTFFLYLAINAALSTKGFIIDKAVIAKLANEGGAAVALKGLLFSSLENIAQQIIVIGFLIGALIAAEKSGIAFAGAFKGAAIAVGTWTTDKAKNMGARAATAPLRSQNAQDFLKKASESKNPFLRLAGMAAARPILSAQTRERAEIDAKIKERDKMPKDLRNLRYAMDFTSSGKMANMMLDARKGDFEGVDTALARQSGYSDELEKLNPALTEKVRTSAEKVNSATTAGEKVGAIENYKKELRQKLDSIKPGDQKDIKLEALLRGAGTGIKEEDWEGSDLGKATIDIIVQKVKADDFSRMTREYSHEKRRAVIDKIIGMAKEDAERADAEEIRSKKLEEFKGRNESLYKYMKSVGNEIFMGVKTEEPGAEKAAESAPKTEGEKK